MKAATYHKYGKPQNISINDVSKPAIEDDKVLVEVHAGSINQADAYILQGKPFPLRFVTGLFKPKNQILGSDISGTIIEVGRNVDEFSIGDEVFGELGINGEGGFAEYVLTNPKLLTLKPKNVSFEAAAAIPMAGLTALQGIQLAGVEEGTKVLIYGASGGVGTFFIQIAKAMNAIVTAVCSTRNIDVAKSSGADTIIDYKKEDWTEFIEKYDVIFAVNGYNKLSVYRDALTPNGTYVSVGGSMRQIFETMLLKPFMRKKMNRRFLGYTAHATKEDLARLASLLEDEKVQPHIGNEFQLSETKEAFEHFMSGKTIGKTVITIKG